jgi:hypothetical protein
MKFLVSRSFADGHKVLLLGVVGIMNSIMTIVILMSLIRVFKGTFMFVVAACVWATCYLCLYVWWFPARDGP